ncbi:MAG: endonuclease/exonuclease/phosphatase family protein [Planctomycetota bacterium]
MTPFANLLQVAVVLSIASVVLGAFGRWHFLPDLLCHFRFQATATLIVAGTMLWLLKRTRWSIASLFFGGILLFSLADYIVPATNSGPADYRLLTMNVLTSNPEKQRVTDYIVAEDPDFILLQEINESWVTHLDERLGGTWPYSKTIPRDDNFGIGIYSKLPWSQIDVVQYANEITTPTISSSFDLPGGKKLRVVVTHPVPPIGGDYWRSRNEHFVAIASDVVSGISERTIVAGDLNCTPWSWHFRELVRRSRLRNSAKGFGPSISWSPTSLTVFGLPIDHVLVGEAITIRDRVVGPHLGSDHRPIIVDFD